MPLELSVCGGGGGDGGAHKLLMCMKQGNRGSQSKLSFTYPFHTSRKHKSNIEILL